MWRILTASLGVGRVSGHRMIGVIAGGDQRPGQQEVSVPGTGCVARLPGTGHVPFTGFVSRSAGAATASSPAAQAVDHLIGVRPAHPVRTQPGHDGHGLRHQPDRTARKITMDLVSTRILTGDVARLAGCCDKATGVHEGKTEGRKQ